MYKLIFTVCSFTSDQHVYSQIIIFIQVIKHHDNNIEYTASNIFISYVNVDVCFIWRFKWLVFPIPS